MQNIESAQTDHNLTKVFKIDEARINNHLGEMVRSTVEQTLNDMLNAEADQLCNAKRYDRWPTIILRQNGSGVPCIGIVMCCLLFPAAR